MGSKKLKIVGLILSLGGTAISVIADQIAKKIQEAEIDEKVSVAVNNALGKE